MNRYAGFFFYFTCLAYGVAQAWCWGIIEQRPWNPCHSLDIEDTDREIDIFRLDQRGCEIGCAHDRIYT